MFEILNKVNDESKKPICVVNDHIDIKIMFNRYTDKINSIRASLSNLESQVHEERKKFWEDLETRMVEKKLITQKEKNQNLRLEIYHGVIFKENYKKEEQS